MESLKQIATSIRRDIIEMVYEAKSGHPGGSLSAVEILTYLYFKEMNINPDNPKADERDHFVLSKGHAAPVLYATLARRGYFPIEELKTLRKLGSSLQGHPDSKKLPGVDISTGSLGQGLSNAVGVALGKKLSHSCSRTFALLGDGELQEGLIWEAAMAAAHYKLNDLIAILDYNKLQIDGLNENVMGVASVGEKFESFGWHVIESYGHSFEELRYAFEKTRESIDKPVIIIAHTTKGKGVSFMENEASWHGAAPTLEQKEQALVELGGLSWA